MEEGDIMADADTDADTTERIPWCRVCVVVLAATLGVENILPYL